MSDLGEQVVVRGGKRLGLRLGRLLRFFAAFVFITHA